MVLEPSVDVWVQSHTQTLLSHQPCYQHVILSGTHTGGHGSVGLYCVGLGGVGV